MPRRPSVLVIGGGISGCAAARAAALAGATVDLVEARPQLGGVVLAGAHRTLCGLAPIDAREPCLLEARWQQPWVDQLAVGAPWKRGRVWLWPTDAALWPERLHTVLVHRRITVHTSTRLEQLTRMGEQWQWHADTGAAGSTNLIIDTGDAPQRWHLPQRTSAQWGAVRGVIAHPGWPGLSARSRALRAIAAATGLQAAATWEALPPANDLPTWQLSLDVPVETSLPQSQELFSRAVRAIDATLISAPTAIASRDDGGVSGPLDAERLFAQHQRGACWAAWPVERHTPTGVEWRWPPRSRYGVPWSVCRPAGLPASVAVLGRGLAVQPDAQAALRVTGTAMALAGRVGWALVRRGIPVESP